LLRGPEGSTLRRRLQNAEFCEGTFCSVAGLALAPQKAADAPECRIGDAVTMIAPLTGNGMSMAFESAVLAAVPLEAYSSGLISWEAAQRRIASDCDAVFARRLRWASWFQRVAFMDGINDLALGAIARIPVLWRLCFQRTRC
jgi:2-polyprenyl-6-methoxyphenol hydroxylase-like FAD-dependent oxidoreductase